MISAARIDELMKDSLFTEDELPVEPKDYIEIRGVGARVGFHPERVMSHKEEIRSLLLQLPDEFMATKGGGMSFLKACVDKDNNHWGEHKDMDALFMLGQAVGLVKTPLPREMSGVLPGGVPYYTVIDKDEDVS